MLPLDFSPFPMLRFLSISRLAVIDAVEVEFGPGFNVLTGETGAGTATQIGVGSMGLVLALIGLVMLTWRTPEIDGVTSGAASVRRPGLVAGITARAHRPRARN